MALAIIFIHSTRSGSITGPTSGLSRISLGQGILNREDLKSFSERNKDQDFGRMLYKTGFA